MTSQLHREFAGPAAAAASFAVNIDQGSTASKAVLEASAAVAPAANFPNVRAGFPPIPSPPTALPAGFMLSHGRVASDGNLTVGMANMNTPGPDDPAAIAWGVFQYVRSMQQGRFSGNGGGLQLTFSGSDPESIDHGSINAETVLEAAAPGSNSILLANPTSALPSGLALSHWRSNLIGLANLTGGAIDPAALSYRMVRAVPALQTSPQRSKGRGPFVCRPRFGANLSATFASIPAAEVQEQTITGVDGVNPNDIVWCQPTAALPAGIAFSHCRTGASAGQVIVGLANLTGGALVPGAVTFEFCHFPAGVEQG